MSSNKAKMIEKLGSEEAYIAYMRKLAKKAGSVKSPTKGNGYITVHGYKKNGSSK